MAYRDFLSEFEATLQHEGLSWNNAQCRRGANMDGDLAMEFGAAAGSPVRRAVPGQFLPIRAGVKDSRDMVLGESLKGDGHSVLLSLTMLLDRLPCYS